MKVVTCIHNYKKEMAFIGHRPVEKKGIGEHCMLTTGEISGGRGRQSERMLAGLKLCHNIIIRIHPKHFKD